VTVEWSLSAAHDVVSAAVPDRDMLVAGGVRRSYGEVRRRTAGLARFLAGHGLGARRERSDLARWECGQSPVGLVMYNRSEYVEAMLACYRARAVPFNVNHHYTPGEVRALLDMVGAEAIVYQRRLGPLLADALAAQRPLLIDVEDGSGVAPLPGSTPYESAVLRPEHGGAPQPSPDDLYMICTGGTTGSPKAVLWRQADIFVAAMGGAEATTPARLAAAATAAAQTFFPAPPLMHAAAQWTAFGGVHVGATIALHDDSTRFDARTILDVAERENVAVMAIIGDAYARPLIDELRRAPRELPALRRIGTGGAITTDECKEALLDLLPGVTIVDGYGASETGGMAYGARTRTAGARGFSPGAGALVLSADRSRVLERGDEEIGWTARHGRVPLGYLGDPKRTEETFPVVDGLRFAVPGDRATIEPDGTIRMLGRDSMVVNTGGEKVFVEEVEKALLRHPAVVDVLVVGRPSRRFGQEVVAIVQTRGGAERVSPSELRAFAAKSIARFKAPRAVAYCDAIGRHATGKPDYAWARKMAESATPVAGAE
jgi:acyl-CoA synthetase (AMP-forming)/AMP-acid ligase II